jgi:hypothetical protein
MHLSFKFVPLAHFPGYKIWLESPRNCANFTLAKDFNLTRINTCERFEELSCDYHRFK